MTGDFGLEKQPQTWEVLWQRPQSCSWINNQEGGGADSQSLGPVNLNPCSWGYLRTGGWGQRAVAGAGSPRKAGAFRSATVFSSIEIGYRDGIRDNSCEGRWREKSVLLPVGE
jgi:hypothetical protein